MNTMSTRQAWERLENWYASQGIGDLDLNPPADDAAIASAEQAMGLTFPNDFKESLKVHDGQHDSAERMLFPGLERLASLEAMVAQWIDERQYDDPADEAVESDDGWFRVDLHHPKRIPIAGIPYWDGDNAYLDLVPGAEGVVGQVLTLTSECDFVVLARSFHDMLVQTVEMLERGELLVNGERLDLVSGPWDGHPAESLCVAKGY